MAVTKLNPRDLVRLRTGRPDLIVEEITIDTVTSIYADANNQIQRITLPLFALIAISGVEDFQN